MERKCSKCSLLLPLDRFSRKKDGYQNYCKTCNTNNKRVWIAENRDAVARNRLWSLYRLRQEDFDALLLKQDGKCALCDTEFPGTPHVDHDHSCCAGHRSCGNCVRGLLCGSCNGKLGWYESRRDKIAAYIEAHSSSGQDASFSHS